LEDVDFVIYDYQFKDDMMKGILITTRCFAFPASILKNTDILFPG